MPDLTTHYLFAKQIRDLLTPDLKSKLELYPNVFAFGAQGPDLFFFRKAGKSEVSKYGGLLHHSKTKEVFDFMGCTLALKKGLERDVLIAYCLGYVCHYYLDKTVHPFVYSEENRLNEIIPNASHHELHSKIESEMDAALYQYFENKPVTSFSIENELRITPVEQWIIASFYSELLQKVFGDTVSPLEIDRSIRDMFRVSKLFYDQTGVFYSTASFFGSIIKPIRSSVNHMKPKKVYRDVLNWQRNNWKNPSPPEQSSNLSVVDLFEQAKQEVIPILEKIEQTGIFEFDTSLDFSGRFPKL